MPKCKSICRYVLRSASVFFAGSLAVGFLVATAHADSAQKTEGFEATASTKNIDALFKFDGTLKSTDDSYTIEGSLHGGCMRQSGTASAHWTLPDGREHIESVRCNDTDNNYSGAEKNISATTEATNGTPVLFLWVCYQRDGQQERCTGGTGFYGGVRYVLGSAKDVLVNSLATQFRGAVVKNSTGTVLAGSLLGKGGKGGSDSYCRLFEGVSLRVTFLPGKQTRGDLLGCPGSGESFFKYAKLVEQIDANAMEIRVCAEKKRGAKCSRPVRFDL